jgi:hypothetical protein
MPKTTTNYGLTKPNVEDFYDVNVQNNNMDIIDTKMKELFDKFMLITVGENNRTDKTMNEIKEAYDNGSIIVIVYNNEHYFLQTCLFSSNSAQFYFSRNYSATSNSKLEFRTDTLVVWEEYAYQGNVKLLPTFFALSTTGGTLDGALTLNVDPTSDRHATNKKYVDEAVSALTSSATNIWLLVENWAVGDDGR